MMLRTSRFQAPIQDMSKFTIIIITWLNIKMDIQAQQLDVFDEPVEHGVSAVSQKDILSPTGGTGSRWKSSATPLSPEINESTT